MEQLEVITFGESMVLFNPDAKGPLRYVNNFSKSIAGAESNVAIALARLGHNVGWFSKLGNDEFGRYIQSVIRGEGVDVSRTVIDKERSTGILFKERFEHVDPNVYYYRKSSAASNLSVEDIDDEYIKNAKIIHITGISPALSDTLRKAIYHVIKVAKENNVLISFDPNIRLKLWDLDVAKNVLLDIAKNADIVFPGISEGKMLLNVETPEDISNKFLSMGCSLVAVKLGKEGCYIASKEESQYSKGYVVETPEDTVGAGDGFAAGVLSGILRKLSLAECAEIGNGVGAMATLVRGDMEGFPTYDQLEKFMGRKDYISR